ncbi:hypothetical protein K5549_020884 [Capra hircus]|nr:hypothetical protein K5549_020884 [Capra hircus]
MKTRGHRTPRSTRPSCGCPEGGWRTNGHPCRLPPPRRRLPSAQHPSRRLQGSLDGRPSRIQACPPAAQGPCAGRTRAGRIRDPAPLGGSLSQKASLHGPACPPELPIPGGGQSCSSKSSGTPWGGSSRPQRSLPLPPRTVGGLRAAQRAFGPGRRRRSQLGRPVGPPLFLRPSPQSILKVRIVKAMVFPVVMHRCELDHKEG